MIKTIVFLTKLVVATIVSLLFASCMIDVKHGNGDIRTENRSIPQAFTKIAVANAIHVNIVDDNTTGVTVEADSNLLPQVKTYVENGTLYIHTEGSYSSDNQVRVKVRMPKVEGLDASEASVINADKKIITDNLTVSTGSSSVIDIEAEADNLTATAESGSTLKITGKALKLNADASSGSTSNLGGLMANDITAEASSGATNTVNPILTLDAKAESGGSVHYLKEPKNNKIISEHSGGSVSH